MFGYRADGRKIKSAPAFFKVIPHIMTRRSDSQVFFKQDIPLKNLDEYIDKKQLEGIKISYMHIVYAAMVRIIAERPALNRFVIDGRLYARNKIFVSLAIKKGMTDEAMETTIKIPFNGGENIFEIKEKLDEIINKNKEETTENDTDKLATVLGLIPNWLMKLSIGFLKLLDKKGLMPRKIIDLSPFHTSIFLTNVGSLGIDTIYHHLYDFGTTGMFLAMGKKKKSYIYDEDDIVEEKCITLGFVGDERICDGFYYATSFKQLIKYLKKPELLEENVEPKKDIK